MNNRTYIILLVLFIQSATSVEMPQTDPKTFLGTQHGTSDDLADGANVNVIGYHPMSEALINAKYMSDEQSHS